MAFVFKSDRKTSLVDNKRNPVGPGDQNIPSGHDLKPQKVPFNSSGTNHEFLFNLNPGPGSQEYNQSHKSSNYAFRSRQERFTDIKSYQPGPGAYKVPTAFKNDKKPTMVIESSGFNNKMSKNTPSIPTRNQVFGYEQDEEGQLTMQTKPESTADPEASVDDRQAYIIASKKGGQTFGKGAQKRDPFKTPNQDIDVGPGQYFTHEGDGVRKRKTGMIMTQKMGQQLKSTKSLMDKEESAPGPGEYESHKVLSAFSRQNKPLRQQFFGSTEDRFRDQPTDLVGPGAQEVKVAKSNIGMHNSNSVRFSNGNTVAPGPGAQDNAHQFENMKHKPMSRSNNFITNVDRFKNLRKNQVPGPGQYQPDSKIPKKTNPTSNFKSESTRIELQKPKEDRIMPGPGQYTDMSSLLKERKGKAVGFDTTEQKLDVQRNNKGYIVTSSERVNLGPGQYNLDSMKNIDLGGGNFGSNKERWESNHQDVMLGPGEYRDGSNWDKKSQNVHFRK